jgi:hypothetical protein
MLPTKGSLQLIQIRERKHFLLGNHSQIDMQEISVNLGHNLTEMARQVGATSVASAVAHVYPMWLLRDLLLS